MDALRKILSDVLHGKYAHIDPIKALKGLTPNVARKKPSAGGQSIWELLFHMAYWQEIVLLAYSGNEAAAKKANDKDSWPTSEDMKKDDEWPSLVRKFTTGLEELVRSSKEDDLEKTLETWGDAPLYYNLLVEIAHNSYHLGQIVAVRKVLDAWPPPE
jgi:uncharacterized damage-inducible protein DinB